MREKESESESVSVRMPKQQEVQAKKMGDGMQHQCKRTTVCNEQRYCFGCLNVSWLHSLNFALHCTIFAIIPVVANNICAGSLFVFNTFQLNFFTCAVHLQIHMCCIRYIQFLFNLYALFFVLVLHIHFIHILSKLHS